MVIDKWVIEFVYMLPFIINWLLVKVINEFGYIKTILTYEVVSAYAVSVSF